MRISKSVRAPSGSSLHTWTTITRDVIDFWRYREYCRKQSISCLASHSNTQSEASVRARQGRSKWSSENAFHKHDAWSLDIDGATLPMWFCCTWEPSSQVFSKHPFFEVTTKPIPHPFIGEFRKQFGKDSSFPVGYEDLPQEEFDELLQRKYDGPREYRVMTLTLIEEVMETDENKVYG